MESFFGKMEGVKGRIEGAAEDVLGVLKGLVGG